MSKIPQHSKISLLSNSVHHEYQHQTELALNPGLPLFAVMTVPSHMVIICIKVIKMWQE